MGGGGGGDAPPPPTYKSRDGKVFEDPNEAADRDRRLQLAASLGYTPDNGRLSKIANANAGKGDMDELDAWLTQVDPAMKAVFDEYDTQGLTAADYRAEKRLKDQENQAKQLEMDRQTNTKKSRSAIDTAFGGFDDNYFSGIAQSVLDYYLPQLDSEFADTNEQLTYKLGRQGILRSKAAVDKRAKLQGDYGVQRSGITNKAADAAREARANVASVKNTLYNYADTAADPADVNLRLSSETARLKAYAPELTPMTKVFSDYITPVAATIGNGLLNEAKGYSGYGTGLFDDMKNGTAQRVVR